jgi:hypothetical protein
LLKYLSQRFLRIVYEHADKSHKIEYIVNVTALCFNLRKYEARNTYGGLDARLQALLSAEYVGSTMISFKPLPLYFAEDNVCFIRTAWFSAPDAVWAVRGIGNMISKP